MCSFFTCITNTATAYLITSTFRIAGPCVVGTNLRRSTRTALGSFSRAIHAVGHTGCAIARIATIALNTTAASSTCRVAVIRLCTFVIVCAAIAHAVIFTLIAIHMLIRSAAATAAAIAHQIRIARRTSCPCAVCTRLGYAVRTLFLVIDAAAASSPAAVAGSIAAASALNCPDIIHTFLHLTRFAIVPAASGVDLGTIQVIGNTTAAMTRVTCAAVYAAAAVYTYRCAIVRLGTLISR